MSSRHRRHHYVIGSARARHSRLTALEQTVQFYQREITALQLITALVLREQPLSEVLQEVVQAVSIATCCPIVALGLYDEEQQVLTFDAATGIPTGLSTFINQTLPHRVVQSGQAVIETHAQDQPEYTDTILHQLGVQTVICLPLSVSERIIGVLTLAHPDAIPRKAGLIPLAQSLANLTALLVGHRQAEDHSKASELQLGEILDKLAAGVVQIDANGIYQYVNRRAAADFGLTPDAMIGKSLVDILPPTVAEAYLERNRRFITEQSYVEREETFDLPIGQRTFFIADQVLTDNHGVGQALLASTIDITAYKQAEAERRRAEELVVSLVDSQESTIATIDINGIYRFINRIGAEQLRATPEVVVGRRLHDFFPHQVADALLQNLRHVIASGQGMVVEELIPTAGMLRWFRTSIQPIRATSGTTVLAMVNALDITERRKAEELLRESQLRVELAFKGANLGMWDWEVQTGRTVFNERWAAIVGYTLAELEPISFQTWERLCHPDDLQRSEMLLQQHVAGESEFYECEVRMRHKDGSWIWIISRGQVVEWSDNGIPIRMAGTHLDITARKQAELTLRGLNEVLEQSVTERTAALKASQERLTLAARSAGIGIWDWDIVNNTLSWDERMYELYGVSPATFGSAYEAWISGLHPDDRAEAELVSQRTRRGEQEYDTEFRVCHPNGAVRFIKAYAVIQRGSDGEPLHMIGINFDITERRQTEEFLRQANLDMAHAVQMKDEFLANMSHELRSPLNAILGFSESLLEQVYGLLTERQQVAVRHIETSSRHLLTLINDILDLSKVEAGRLSLACERIKIDEICQESLLFVKELAFKKSLKLIFQLNDPWIDMEADPKRLKQMLVNLLSNAVKFTPTGGKITLEVVPDLEAKEVRFAVRDTGIGIAAEDLARLFQPFSQLDSSLSRQHEGTGLGLALVRRLAQLHGGNVRVESTLGQGSCFTITLPQYASVPTAEQTLATVPIQQDLDTLPPMLAAEPTIEQDTPRARLLLAEDNHFNIQTTSDYLEAKGYAVIVGQTGPEVLAAAIEHLPDAILMDIQLPEIDGFELIRRLRALPMFASTPIIAVTALAMPGDRERCLAAGANAYLGKPVRLKELVGLIDQLLHT